METVYTKRFIKTLDDLPKEKHVNYYCCTKYGNIFSIPFDNPEYWLKNIDWFLEPRELPTDEEVIIYFNNHASFIRNDYPKIQVMARGDVLKLVAWLRDKIK